MDKISPLLTFYKNHHRPPTYREIMNLFKYKSPNAAYKLVNRLIKKKIFIRDANGKFIPSKRLLGTRILGTVEAGWPSPAEEELVDTMTLDEFLIGNREATYMLTVSGDSMIEAGIQPGDIALVERGRTPKDGDIVVAEVDKGWTLKYFRKKGKVVHLEPANKKYKPIYPKDELVVAAVVTAVIRKYHRV